MNIKNKHNEAKIEDKVSKTEDKESKTEVSTQCGIGLWYPQYMQIFASKKFYTFMLCLFALVEGALILLVSIIHRSEVCPIN